MHLFLVFKNKQTCLYEHGSVNATYYEVASFIIIILYLFFLTEKDSAQANEKKPHKKQAKTSQEVSKLDECRMSAFNQNLVAHSSNVQLNLFFFFFFF